MADAFDPRAVDADALATDLDALRRRLKASVGAADVAHLRRLRRWQHACTLVGLATAWWAPNPLTVLALSAGLFIRWAVVGHHICHRSMDGLPGSPWQAKRFGRGWRRLVDWFDWMPVEGWHLEHDHLHHGYTGEARDPDLPERNAFWLRALPAPRALKVMLVWLGSAIWKPLYYGPNAVNAQFETRARRRGEAPSHVYNRRLWDPRYPAARAVWIRAWLPVLIVRFGIVPALFLPLGVQAWSAALINIALAEILTNVHAFWIIVPNHVGPDVFRFDAPAEGRAAWYLHQILGSANYRTGGDLNDVFHGFLNYQIEHHLWPELPPLQLRRAQPEVAALCAQHGVPYLQESVITRGRKCLAVLTGAASMRRWPPAAPPGAPPDHPPAPR